MAPTSMPTLSPVLDPVDPRGVLTHENVDAAIVTVEDSRRTHLNWAEWRRRGGQGDEMAGDLDHHETAIAEYDHVLNVLRALRRLIGDGGL